MEESVLLTISGLTVQHAEFGQPEFNNILSIFKYQDREKWDMARASWHLHHWQHNRLFNSLFRPESKKTSKIHWCFARVIGGFHPQRASDVERVFIPWCHPGPCVTTVTWRCHKNFSPWECSFHWKLRCHWLEFLRQIAVVRQGPVWNLARVKTIQATHLLELSLKEVDFFKFLPYMNGPLILKSSVPVPGYHPR